MKFPDFRVAVAGFVVGLFAADCVAIDEMARVETKARLLEFELEECRIDAEKLEALASDPCRCLCEPPLPVDLCDFPGEEIEGCRPGDSPDWGEYGYRFGPGWHPDEGGER